MEHVILDTDLCLRDGLCASACPLGLIRLHGEKGDEQGLPLVPEGMGAHCIGCGHCVAACPSGALMLKDFAPEQFSRIDRSLLPAPEQLDMLLRSRRSVRNFRKKTLAENDIQEILEITRWAPSGHNAQPVEWTVARDRDSVVRVVDAVVDWMRWACEHDRDLARAMFLPGTVRAWEKGKDIVTRGAPHLVVAHVPNQGATPEADGIIAAAWAELAAHGRGLGACWCGYAMMARGHDSVNQALNIPQGRVMAAALMLGRPRWRYTSIPPRKSLSVKWF